ncbi:MAG: hypothetical protein II817_08910 [Bacteroidales bacterium]|nr:hypothetical protein [Bacteroidales bacterium]
MKNRKLKLKSVFFTMAMAFGMLLPVTASAQSDGFFRGGGDYSNRDAGGGAYSLNNQTFGSDDNGGYNLNNQTFGQETAPLGTGLLILTAAGAGYVALKRKKY